MQSGTTGTNHFLGTHSYNGFHAILQCSLQCYNNCRDVLSFRQQCVETQPKRNRRKPQRHFGFPGVIADPGKCVFSIVCCHLRQLTVLWVVEQEQWACFSSKVQT